MAQQVNLVIKEISGRVVGEYTINAGSAPLQIEAVNNVYYEFIDTASGRGPAMVSGTRNGDDLVVSIDNNNSLIIKNYFTNGQGALVGMRGDGSPYIYPTIEAIEHTLASEIGSDTGAATTNSSSLSPAAVAGIIGGVALTAGGIAIAKHNHDKHHHHGNNPQPQPHPQPQPNPNPQPNNNKGTITVNGEAKVGSTLTASVKDADGTSRANIKYSWYANGEKVGEGANYTIKDADKGKTLTAKAEYTDDKGHAENIESKPTAPVADGTPPQNQPGEININGEAKVGSTLTASVKDADGTSKANIKYSWYANGEKVGEGANYTIKDADKGKTLTAKAEYTDDKGHAENIESKPTASVADGTPPQPQPSFPQPTLTKGAGAEQGGVTITPPDEATYLRVDYESNGHPQSLTLTRANTSSPWQVKEGTQKPDGVNFDAKTGVTKIAPAAVDDNSTLSAIAGKGTSYSDRASVTTDPDSGTPQPSEAELTLSGDNSVVEGEKAGYTLRLSKPAEKDVTVTVSIKHGTTDDGNVKTETRTITIPKGSQSATFDVQALNNNSYQPNRTFNVGVDSVSGAKNKATTVETTISDNDPPPAPSLTAGSEPGSVVVKPLQDGIKKLTVSYRDENNNEQTLTVTRNDNGKWSSTDLPRDHVTLDENSGTVTLGGKALKDGSTVTAHNDSEYAEGSSATLNAGYDNGQPPANQQGTVTIAGDAKVGSTLTATVTDGDGVPDNGVQYQWLRDGKPIDKATGKTYTLSKDDAGHKISVQATYKDNANHDENPISPARDIANPPGSGNHAGSVAIKGEAKVGNTLTAEVSDRDGVPENGVTYQWFGNDKPINGANGQTFQLTAAQQGMQMRVEAAYTDKAGHKEKPISDLSPAVVPENSSNHSNLFPPPATNAPRVSLSGVSSVTEGQQAKYKLTLDKPADEDVSVDVRIVHGTTDASDAKVTYGLKRVVIPKGQISREFTVDTMADGKAEGNEKYTLEIHNAVVGNIQPRDVPPFSGSVTAQSQIIPAYKYPTGAWEKDTYWDTVHKLGGGKIPYTIINPASGAGEKTDPNYSKLVDDNIAAGIKNIGYIRTIYQSRPIEEVKAEVDKYLKYYGKDKIHGFFFDEIDSQSNGSTAYMAELYRYVKSKAGNKTVIANPGTHITDDIAPYADIFVTTEVGANQYINGYEKPKSAFENDPKNASRIYHMIHDVPPEQYDQVLKLARERNAGWVYITSDKQENPLPPSEHEKHPEQDGNPYNVLPQNMESLTERINNLGKMPDSPTKHVEGKIVSANIGNSSVTTEIIDADSASGNLHAPKQTPIQRDDATDVQSAHHDQSGAEQHSDSAGHNLLLGEELHHANLSGLLNLESEAMLNYLGEHSSSLLSQARAHSGAHGIQGSDAAETFITAHGNHLLSGGKGADTFAFLLDGRSSGDRITDFNIAEGDRLVFAGEHMKGAQVSVSHERGGTQVNVTDSAGNSHSVDITSKGGKPLSDKDILSHVELRGPQEYHETAYHGNVNQHLPEEGHHSGIVI